MSKDVNQTQKNQTWEPGQRLKDKKIIGTKWVFRSKLNENGKIVRNKERMVCKGYTHLYVIEFEETFSHVVRLESIRMFLEFESFNNFKVYRMDVKLTFQNEI